jgi:DNA-binding response OmpR family regulator
MRILVVEDEATLRETLKTRFGQAGFTVDVARDGDEGVFAALEYPLDVAIVDLGLPGVPGMELIRRVVLDTRAQTVAVRGAPVELTTFEYRILEHLMLRAGEVISKGELTERLYDQDFERDSNVIEVLIGRLRRKLDPQEELQPIETLRGRGYRFSLARDAGP